MRILIIEDDPTIATNLYDYLEAHSHSVDAAGDQLDGNVPKHGVAEEGLRYSPCRDDRRWLNHHQSAFWRYFGARSCSNIASSKFE